LRRNVGNLIPTPPATITWNPNATVDHNTQRTAGAYWDFPDIAITFRLTAPRVSSPVADLVVSGGPGGAAAPLNNAALTTLLAGLGQGQPPPGQLAAESVDTIFHLDLLIDAATLHLGRADTNRSVIMKSPWTGSPQLPSLRQCGLANRSRARSAGFVYSVAFNRGSS
jgi:hypothetical protein